MNTASYETNGNWIGDKRGKIGTVKKVTRKDYSNSHFEYYIAWNDGTQASYYMAEQDLKLATGRFNALIPNSSENNSSAASTTSASSTTANSSANDTSISTSTTPTYKMNQQINVSLMQDGVVNKHAGRVIKINNNQAKTSYDIQLSDGSVIKQLPAYTLTAK
ncbi:hypothetical protein IV73_GL000367 [Weissella kandleri]|uniref:Uncharacterized protein n=1 Tax=Weissella kandleri TaxID=1616 RepID=A0A0R2JIB6_9LACO|nr:hypothetical protein IV73_GL000367 [Weissella kandleri]